MKRLLDVNYLTEGRQLVRATAYAPVTDDPMTRYEAQRFVQPVLNNGYKIVTDVLSLKELEDIAANYKRVAGFQVEGLNAKPPIVQLAR